MKETTKTVICPTCKKSVDWIATNTFRPFCSKRCKMIDLGAWANEDYNLPASEDLPLSEEITQNRH